MAFCYNGRIFSWAVHKNMNGADNEHNHNPANRQTDVSQWLSFSPRDEGDYRGTLDLASELKRELGAPADADLNDPKNQYSPTPDMAGSLPEIKKPAAYVKAGAAKSGQPEQETKTDTDMKKSGRASSAKEDKFKNAAGGSGGNGGGNGGSGNGGTSGQDKDEGGRQLSFMQRLTRRLSMLSLKIGLICAGVLVLLFIYFDSVVLDKFEVDDKWVLPAVVYSRPLELYPDQRLSLKQMEYELELLKYRKTDNPQREGEYAVNYDTNKLVVIKRPFTFPEGQEDRMSLLVSFDGQRVVRIMNADLKQDLSYVRMDPVLLDRINRIDPKEDRIFITLDEVPQELITTLLEIEDRSFYSHIGVNFFAIARAFVKNMMAGRVVEGGSTITQQLVKNYFLTNEKSYSRKFKEIIMAIIMDHRYTKDQILEAYMNEIYLGQNGNAGIYGFGLASYFYFGVPVSELSLDQMALLVGLIKGPSYYDPWRHPENALERRNTVLAVLEQRGHLTKAQCEQYMALPLRVIKRGSMNYTKTPAFMGLLKHEISTRFGPEFLSGNGIRIFTSLDPQAQAAAEKAVSTELDAIEKDTRLKGLEAAMVVSSWRTAEVSAVVGSRTPKYDGFNRVIEGRRQIGSLAKPFVYLTAFSRGFHLGSIVDDSPLTVRLSDGKLWSPRNDDNRFRGPITVLRAYSRSLNVPTVRVGMASGLANVRDTFKKVGLQQELQLYPSMLLGSMALTPYELNAMYASMATDGVYQNLTTLRTVVKDGQIFYERSNERTSRTLDPRDTYLTLYGMTEATRSGTGTRLSREFPGVNIGSKTGTTNDQRDTWSTGIDSDELVTTWVGFDDNKKTSLWGSSGALRVYAAYLKERGVNSLELKRPEGIKFVNFDKQGQVVADGCKEPGLTVLPAREDMIQYIRPCNLYNTPGPQVQEYAPLQAKPAPAPAAAPATPAQKQQNSDANAFERFLLGL